MRADSARSEGFTVMSWQNVLTSALLIGGGLGAIALGQVSAGICLLGAAAGHAVPLAASAPAPAAPKEK